MSADEQKEKTEVESAEPLLEYVYHPAKTNNRLTTILTIMVIFICVALVYFITYSPFFSIIGGVILIVALSAYFFPTRYIFYDSAIHIKTTTQTLKKEWSLYRSYYADKNGVLLSPFGRPTRLENFRGQYVRFSSNRDAVMDIVKSKIKFEGVD